jgi:peptidoglycan/LPS O-acetylase OafA/YrhL
MENSKTIPYLDGWRGLAIACLLAGHFFPLHGIYLGTLGVHLFFLLSGFLMAKLLFVRRVTIGSFYRRRISRVFPSVYAFIVAMVALQALVALPLNWDEILPAATFTNNYLFTPQAASVMPFGHIWSLSVEEHSYVILSLVALGDRAGWLRARPVVGLLALASAAFSVMYWIAFPAAQVNWFLRLHTEVSSFGIFASSYLLLRLDGLRLGRVPLAACVAILALAVAAHWWWAAMPVTMIIGVGAFALAINLLHLAPGVMHAVMSLAPLRRLGIWSFSLYLWQQPFYEQVRSHGLHPVVGLALALGTGIVAHYLLEKPARTWLNRHWDAPRTALAAPDEQPLAA